jgi:hypothetical protein
MRVAVVATLWSHSLAAQSAPATVTVPFVGCPSAGQAGESPPPEGSPKVVTLGSELAERIAYYIGEHSQGVFAPRGWHCQVIYGSSGGTLVVTPAAVDGSQFYRSGVRGPAVELEGSNGGSGRFEVAAFATLLFPNAAAAFIKYVGDMDPEILRDEIAGLYHAHDSIQPGTGRLGKFTTPSNAKGLGTACSLAPDSDPIHGLAVFDDGTLSVLRVRIGPGLQSIEAAILRLNEECMLSETRCLEPLRAP